MKTSVKRVPIISALLLIVSFLCAAVLALNLGASRSRVSADQAENEGLTYYYSELKNSELAQRFYGVFDEMNNNGYFVDGKKDYDLSDVLTQAELSDYIINGSPRIPVALGAARDAFFMDHPDLFYVDVHKLVFSFGMKDDVYYAYLGAGRADNYYEENTVSSAAEVQTAVTKYNAAVDAIVNGAKAASIDPVERIKYVNKAVAEKIEYSYGAYEDRHEGREYNGFVHTAYAIVEGEALCDGYATAFKAVMDRLDIPCVLVEGSVYAGQSVATATGSEEGAGYESHMWNAVKVDGLWYVVDVTWNDTTNKLDKYLLVGSSAIADTHVERKVISSSGFELQYPAIRPIPYGVDTDEAGFSYKDSGTVGGITFGYSKDDEGHYDLQLGVSFQGKNIRELRDEGKSFAFRAKNADGWIAWCSYTKIVDFELESYSEAEAEEYWKSMVSDHYTVQRVDYSTEQIRFAVVDCEPADGGFYYTDAEMDEHALGVSSIYSNDAYMRFVPAPYMKLITPNEKGTITSMDPITISMEYDEQLVVAEGKTINDIGIDVVGTHAEVRQYVEVKDVTFDAAANKVSFTFIPGKEYRYNYETYSFTPINLVGKDSNKVPTPGRLTFEREKVICPKVFNDGRLYMKLFGVPEFVSASDESLNQFKDKNGQPIVGDQRSQLMLVVNEPKKAESDAMANAAKEQLGLTDSDIKASSTYQIDLQVCGVIRQVPKGSYMQVGFGFPDGFGPDDAGVTFTVYHYTRKANGEIDTVEEVPCVITEYGIIATVKSFSPFMICAVDSAKVQTTTKNILVSVNGVGGKVDKPDIITLDNESVTYTITPDSNYSVFSVLVNGKERKADVSGGKLTLTFAELKASNTVVVSFIANSVVAADAQKGITRIADPSIVVEDKDMIKAYVGTEFSSSPTAPPVKPGKKSNAGLIAGIVVPIVVVLIGAGLAIFFILRNKSKQEKATAGGKANTKTTSSAKSTASQTAATKTTTNTNRPAQPTTGRTTQTNAARPAQPTANRTTPTNAARPAQSTANRTTSTNTARPAQPTANRTATTNRPVTPNRPTTANRPQSNSSSTRNNDKK